MSKKPTKKDFLIAIKTKYPLTADELAFVEHEIELLSKKSGKPTARQKANEPIKEKILAVLAESESGMTVTQIANALNNEYAGQHITAILWIMKDNDNTVKREMNGKTALFSLA